MAGNVTDDVAFYYSRIANGCEWGNAVKKWVNGNSSADGGVCAWIEAKKQLYECPSSKYLCWNGGQTCSGSNNQPGDGQQICLDKNNNPWCCWQDENCDYNRANNFNTKSCLGQFGNPLVNTAAKDAVVELKKHDPGVFTRTSIPSGTPTPFSILTAQKAVTSTSSDVSESASSSSAVESASSQPSVSKEHGITMSAGAIAGIVLGVVLAILLSVIATVLVLRERRRRSGDGNMRKSWTELVEPGHRVQDVSEPKFQELKTVAQELPGPHPPSELSAEPPVELDAGKASQRVP